MKTASTPPTPVPTMRIAAPIAASVPRSASVCAERTVPSSAPSTTIAASGSERDRRDRHRRLRLRGHGGRHERPRERGERGEVRGEEGDDGCRRSGRPAGAGVSSRCARSTTGGGSPRRAWAFRLASLAQRTTGAVPPPVVERGSAATETKRSRVTGRAAPSRPSAIGRMRPARAAAKSASCVATSTAAPCVGELRQRGGDEVARVRVQAARRLVEQQHARRGGELHGQREHAALAGARGHADAAPVGARARGQRHPSRGTPRTAPRSHPASRRPAGRRGDTPRRRCRRRRGRPTRPARARSSALRVSAGRWRAARRR